MAIAGKGVCDSFFICVMVLIFFYYGHRPEGPVAYTNDLVQIIDGFHIAAGIGRYIDV